MTWSPPCWPCAADPGARVSCSELFVWALASSTLLGVCGGFGVGAREPHGDRLERKPGLLSGAVILSVGGASPPEREMLSQDFARYAGPVVGSLETRCREQTTRRAQGGSNVVGGLRQDAWPAVILSCDLSQDIGRIAGNTCVSCLACASHAASFSRPLHYQRPAWEPSQLVA